MDSKELAARLAATKVFVVDDEHYMRKVVRTLLMSIGVRAVYEAADGPAGLEVIDGVGFVRMVRSPETFPFPDVPIIMLTGHGERSRVVEAIRIGVNEFLLKPVSFKSLQGRLASVLTKLRPVVQSGGYYGPVPRNLAATINTDGDHTIAKLILVN